MTFRPTLWPTLISLPAIALLLGLGFWQIERMYWKSELIGELQTRSGGPAIALPLDDRISIDDLMYRKVTVSGRFMNAAEMHLLNRVRGGVPGIHLITPLVRADGGGTILVDRGWVPLDWQGSPVDAEAVVTVTGIVRVPEPPGMLVRWLTPENQPRDNEWFSIDLAAMAGNAGVLPFTDYYVLATGEAPPPAAPYPAANVWAVDLPNDHLSYAITWFSLAAALLAIYLIYHSKARRRDDD